MPGESVDDVVALLNVAEDHVSEALRAVRQALQDAAEVTRVVANVGLIDKSRQLNASLSHVTGADDTLEKLGEDLRNAIEGFVLARGHESGEPGRLDFGSLYRPRADAFAFSSRTVVPTDELTPLDPSRGEHVTSVDDLEYDDAGPGASDPVDFSAVEFNADQFKLDQFTSGRFASDDLAADDVGSDDVDSGETAPVTDDATTDAEPAEDSGDTAPVEPSEANSPEGDEKPPTP